jgi:hypothetical protein
VAVLTEEGGSAAMFLSDSSEVGGAPAAVLGQEAKWKAGKRGTQSIRGRERGGEKQ